jgi:hypothetical protein
VSHKNAEAAVELASLNDILGLNRPLRNLVADLVPEKEGPSGRRDRGPAARDSEDGRGYLRFGGRAGIGGASEVMPSHNFLSVRKGPKPQRTQALRGGVRPLLLRRCFGFHLVGLVVLLQPLPVLPGEPGVR